MRIAVVTAVLAIVPSCVGIAQAAQMENAAFRVSVVPAADGSVAIAIDDLADHRKVSDGPYFYRAVKAGDKTKTYALENAVVSAEDGNFVIRGRLAGLDFEQILSLPTNRPILEERIVLRNGTPSAVSLAEFEAGFTLRVTDAAGAVLPEMVGDRWAAVPFLRRAEDAKSVEYDFATRTLLDQPGFVYVPQVNVGNFAAKRVPSLHRFSEGWAWRRGPRTLGIFSFNQVAMTFATVTPHNSPAGKRLRFGGGCLLETTLGALRDMKPGQSVDLGATRFQSLEGGYNAAAYAFRVMLDEKGCRFPADYNPPIHWEQYFDMVNCWNDRPKKYTLALLEQEAAKGVEFSCEALYLDPGWDTTFGSFLWGPWLGSQKEFIDRMQTKYGLKVGMHFPLPPWSLGGDRMNSLIDDATRGLSAWPEDCRRRIADGSATAPAPTSQPWVCMGSKQYLDEAEKRILKSCEAGIAFIMFDGNWWNGPCADPRHGHPIPYTYEDHIRANLELARRVHAKYPKVLIEMHDMLAGGEWRRMTPVYYKYALPGSYDENWGFELMWAPMKNLQAGTTDALYYYALGCNVPMYLHVALDGDNEHAVSLWWYASTCRHLGIGGKAKNPAVAKKHAEAMKQYRRWEEFYKRGEFYGISREIHLHVLPKKKAFTVNVFNLSGEKRTIEGSIDLKTLGLDATMKYLSDDGLGTVENGRYRVGVELPAWGAKAAAFHSLQAAGGP